jgi:hypothetical protein
LDGLVSESALDCPPAPSAAPQPPAAASKPVAPHSRILLRLKAASKLLQRLYKWLLSRLEDLLEVRARHPTPTAAEHVCALGHTYRICLTAFTTLESFPSTTCQAAASSCRRRVITSMLHPGPSSPLTFPHTPPPHHRACRSLTPGSSGSSLTPHSRCWWGLSRASLSRCSPGLQLSAGCEA